MKNQDIKNFLSTGNHSPDQLGDLLRAAAREGVVEAAGPLVAAGASPDSPSPTGRWTPLHVAVEHGQEQVIRRLAALGADLNFRADGGMTPLHLAVDAASDLLSQLADQADSQEQFEAARAVVRLLLEIGASKEVQDDEGLTPADWANDSGLEALKCLF